MPNLYIIAGCNGAGKTTASFTVLPDILNCREFVNADEIARGLSPFQPETVALQAGRIMLERVQELLREAVDFAVETTLATKTYIGLVKDAQAKGYTVLLVYFWLNSPELAADRVRKRVAEGGHNIPPDVIKRRYQRGVEQLVRHFVHITNEWLVFDNSVNPREKIAEGGLGKNTEIYSAEKWNTLHAIANGQ